MGIAGAVNDDLTRRGVDGTCNGFNEGGFAGAVLTDQSMYLAFLEGDGYVIQRGDAGIYFCNMFQFQFRGERLLSA